MNWVLLWESVGIVVAALAAAASLRNRWIREHGWILGVWFGGLSVLLHLMRVEIADVQILLSLRNVPVIAAGFFFDPAVGLIAGGIAAAGRIAVPLAREGMSGWLAGGIATLGVAFYAVAMKKWVFNDERPLAVTAAAAAAVGMLFYLMIVSGILLWTDELVVMLDVLYAEIPDLPLWTAGGIGAISLGCTRWSRWRDWRNTLRSVFFWGILLYCGAFWILLVTARSRAYQHTDAMLRDAMEEVDTRIREQIHFMLHRTATAILERVEVGQAPSLAVMQQCAMDYDVDEINVFAADGTLLATNLPEVAEHNRQHKLDPEEDGVMRPFFALTTGESTFVKSDFRSSRSDPRRKSLYIGVPMPDGKSFLELGYGVERLEREFEKYFRPMFSKSNIGETGYFLLTDASGKILIAGGKRHPEAEGKWIRQIGMTPAAWAVPENQLFEARLFGEWGVCGHQNDLMNLRTYAVLPYVEFFPAIVQQCTVAGLLLFGLMILFRWVLLQNFRKQAKIDAMRAEDLAIAARIQNSELQRKALVTTHCRCEGCMVPAKEVGGDFYDYYVLPDGRVVILIADVSGKGIPAALFMMKSKKILHDCIGEETTLAGALNKANSQLNRHNDAVMFVTAWVGIYDAAAGVLEFVSAGHNPPLIRRKNGTVEWLRPEKRQKPLAAFPQSAYQTFRSVLKSGDRLFLYTDGVTETMDRKGELFGEKRLEEVLSEAADCLQDRVKDALVRFMAQAPQADDITMLTLEVKDE